MADGSLPRLPNNVANAAGSTSMPCPVCGGGTAVHDCRPSPHPVQSIRRRRVCVACRHRFTTREVTDDWLEGAHHESFADMAVVEEFLKDALAFVQSVKKP